MKRYTDMKPGGWVGAWMDTHNDAWHEWPREECDECQRMIARDGRMPSKAMLLRGYEMLKRPEYKMPIPNWLRKQVFERDGYRCLHCGATEKLCADHIIAEIKGGPTTLENLQTLCRSCNCRKSDK